MGYRRSRRSRWPSYDRESAQTKARKAHVEAAAAFSKEVGNADEIVKKTFFALTGKAQKHILDRYEELYGREAREYAEITIPKWYSGQRRMSGLVARRLFELIPPLMPVEQKYEIVEIVWKRHGPQSEKYVYVGPDADQSALIADIEQYFSTLKVKYTIPPELERRFDWLSDNDVAVKQKLLNHFMEGQQSAAIASARLNIEMMLSRLNHDAVGSITKLSYTLLVGNHRLELCADRFRRGYEFSDLHNGYVREKSRAPKRPWAFVAAIVAGIIWLSYRPASPPADSAMTGQSGAASRQEQGRGQAAAAPAYLERDPVVAPTARAVARTDQVQRSSGAAEDRAVREASESVTPRVTTRPPLAASQRTAASAGMAISAGTANVSGCSRVAVVNVEDDGTIVDLSDGSRIEIDADGIMRVQAGQWSTGDEVTLCGAGASRASVSNQRQIARLQGTVLPRGSPKVVTCRDGILSGELDNGTTLVTTDGRSYSVSSAGVMQVEAAQWRTGESVDVCTSRLDDGSIAASIEDRSHFGKVQAAFAGTTAPSAVTCRDTSIAESSGDGGAITTGDGRSYTVSQDGVDRIQASQWTTGDGVRVCEARVRGQVVASMANASHFASIQAFR
jgi:hypothetical protein